MSEINEEKETKHCCVCKALKSEFTKKVVAIALGTFIGVYCSLSLYGTVHKPKFHKMPKFEQQQMHHGSFEHKKTHHGDFIGGPKDFKFNGEFKGGEFKGKPMGPKDFMAPKGDFGPNIPKGPKEAKNI